MAHAVARARARTYVTPRTHVTAPYRWLVRQYHATLLGACLHQLMMLSVDPLTSQHGFGRMYAGTILVAFLLSHQLRAVDLFLLDPISALRLQVV